MRNLIIIIKRSPLASRTYCIILCALLLLFFLNLISPLLYTVIILYTLRRSRSHLLAFYIVRITVRALRAQGRHCIIE